MYSINLLSLIYFFAAVCPLGYESKVGDIPGWGDSELGSALLLTREECAQKCNENYACLSFEHSYTEGYCNLNKAAKPTSGPYNDYAFCTKTGRHFCLLL